MTRRFLLPFCALLCLTACTASFGMAPTLDTDLVEPGTVSAVQAAIEEADFPPYTAWVAEDLWVPVDLTGAVPAGDLSAEETAAFDTALRRGVRLIREIGGAPEGEWRVVLYPAALTEPAGADPMFEIRHIAENERRTLWLTPDGTLAYFFVNSDYATLCPRWRDLVCSCGGRLDEALTDKLKTGSPLTEAERETAAAAWAAYAEERNAWLAGVPEALESPLAAVGIEIAEVTPYTKAGNVSAGLPASMSDLPLHCSTALGDWVMSHFLVVDENGDSWIVSADLLRGHIEMMIREPELGMNLEFEDGKLVTEGVSPFFRAVSERRWVQM